jgi:hypothetical protein
MISLSVMAFIFVSWRPRSILIMSQERVLKDLLSRTVAQLDAEGAKDEALATFVPSSRAARRPTGRPRASVGAPSAESPLAAASRQARSSTSTTG